MIARVIEVTFLLVALYLVLTHFQGFSAVISTIGNSYVGAVRALQGAP